MNLAYLNEMPALPSSDQYDAVRIMLASPEMIRHWSHGEVRNAETINYRTYKPERDGLFCERIFGPTKDWECSCGKYKRIKHKGVVCDRCGVEVTVSRVRRQRMGHIELAVPVSHIWFFKCTPSRIGTMLDIPVSQLERVIYYEDRLVVDPGETPLQYQQLLSEEDYNKAVDEYGEDSFKAHTGAEAVRECLEKIDLDELMDKLEQDIENTSSKQKRKTISKRMRICEGFRRANARPEWMVLEVMPVIPPDLRPLVPLEGGKFATSDLNDLYRRVINRNNRLAALKQMKTPDVIIRNEKRMLQEAVDAVFDNGRHGKPIVGAGNRALKSLSDMLKGKTGRFRQNLLGKRVDYSGRSVIVVGPRLKLYQCGLPKKMALTLFEPFIVRRLIEQGLSLNSRTARKFIERQDKVVWDALDYVIRGKTVMLNRAPTLHRLSIQSFEPVLIEGEAIQLHPMVCTAFNADFDGDQMAVHVPLSVEAQLESRLLMLASNSIFSPASGKSIMTPTQDIALGIYYLTEVGQQDKLAGHDVGKDPINPAEHLPLFNSIGEILLAKEQGGVGIHSRVLFRNPDYGRDTTYGKKDAKVIETTVGRVIFNEIWPDEVGFINIKVDKSRLGDLILACHRDVGHARTVVVLDDLKALGYEYATKAGVSMGLKDMIRPAQKDAFLDAAREESAKIGEQFNLGLITDGERHNKIVDVWTNTTDKIADDLYMAIDRNENPDAVNPNETNPLFMMFDSKARGSKQQIRQLAGMRGLMAKPSGEIIETPITASFREGLSILEYFISSHGARKGLADTALKTADAGYLTRRLVDVSQDVIIVMDDCNSANGIEIKAEAENENAVPLTKRILGRTALRDIYDPNSGELILPANEEIDEVACAKIKKAGIERVWIRSGLTCEAPHGMCAKCYGRDLSTGKPVEIGTAVGIVAAQSIGEPGTQLTMRTFHVGGTASASVVSDEIKVHHDGFLTLDSEVRTVLAEDGREVVLNKGGAAIIQNAAGHELERIPLQIGTTLLAKFKTGMQKPFKVKADELIANWDPHSIPVISEFEGRVRYDDFIQGDTVEIESTDAKGNPQYVVRESTSEAHPYISILVREKGSRRWTELKQYPIPVGARVMVADGDTVKPGVILAKTPRQAAKTRDITGGLPRVAELFEARHPGDHADIAKIDGQVSWGPNARGCRCVIVTDETTGETEEHLIRIGKHVVVNEGDHVRKGQQLTDGPIIPQEILDVCGPQELQRYLVEEVQQVYGAQGVEINDKHIEIIIRQMLRKVQIVNPGDTDFLVNDLVSRQQFLKTNDEMRLDGKRPAEARPALLGITKASLETDSFISAASFQDTTRVLADAATLGRVDELRGFKENVILGHLIPGGTGFTSHRHIKLEPLAEPIPADLLAQQRKPLFVAQDVREEDEDDEDEDDEGFGISGEDGIAPKEELVDDPAALASEGAEVVSDPNAEIE